MIRSQCFYNWLRVFLAAFLLASSVPATLTVQRLAAASQPVFGHTVTKVGLRHHSPQIARSFSRTADLERGDPAEHDVRTAAFLRSRHVSWLPILDGKASYISANFPALGIIPLDLTASLAASPFVSGCGPRAPPSVIPTA